jgi:tRNA A37 methylthiotransferase MiaB
MPAVIADRRRRLVDLERELAEKYMRGLVGRQLDVLVEGSDPERIGHVRGTSCRHVPVTFASGAALVRRRVLVRITGVSNGVLLGRPDDEVGQPRIALPLAATQSRSGS